MKSTTRVCTIPLSHLDAADTRYLLSPRDEHPDQELIASIRKYGLLHPPLVQETNPNTFIIVAGRKRTKAFLQTTSADAMPCLVVPPAGTDLDTYALLLEYIQTDGPLSIIEQIAFLEKTLALSTPELTLPFLNKLGYKANRHTLDQLLALRNLSSAAQLALHEGIITSTSARKMLRLSREDQITLIRIVRQLKLGGSKQQQLIQMATELIIRRNKSLDNILAGFSVPEDGMEMPNIPQKTATLLRWLHHECSPQLTEAETRFKARIARLRLPAEIEVRHTPSFEDDRVCLSIDFQDWQSMQRILTRIQPDMEQNNQTP